jgi:hypothetical protein
MHQLGLDLADQLIGRARPKFHPYFSNGGVVRIECARGARLLLVRKIRVEYTSIARNEFAARG